MTLPRADDSTSLYRPKLANHKERKEHRAAKQKLQERGAWIEARAGAANPAPRSCTVLLCVQPANKLVCGRARKGTLEGDGLQPESDRARLPNRLFLFEFFVFSEVKSLRAG
jgi:hypothetical protein